MNILGRIFLRSLLGGLLSATFFVFAASCSGEDRSGEQPFPPTVQTLSAIAQGNACQLEGVVTASPNSRITGCGFLWGNDTLRVQTVSRDTLDARFSTRLDSLLPGTYFATAFATNGMGTSYGDTLFFEILGAP